MPLIHRYERAIGIRLWRWNRYQIEIWFCGPNWTIRPHSHPDEDIELAFVFGIGSQFARQKWPLVAPETFTPKFPRHVGRRFSVAAGTVHWFTVSKWPLVFINFERWHKTPTSAAIDLKPI